MSLLLPQKIVNDLIAAFRMSFEADVGRLRVWVQVQLGTSLNAIKKSLLFDEILLDLYYWVNARGPQGWVQLLTYNEAASKDYLLLREPCELALAALTAVSQPGKTGAHDLFIWDCSPFVDRAPFWIDVEELLTSKLKRVVVVNGPPRSGKSYCGELLDHLRHRWPGTRMALVNLADERSPDLAPLELCRRILLKLRITPSGPPPDPLPGQKPDRWARDLAAWATLQIPTGSASWVILDGFDQPGVPEETHVFIAALAAEARDHADLRLALLGYDRPLGDRTERATRRTRIDYITASDLHLYLSMLDKRYSTSAHPGWPAVTEFVTQYVQHPPGSATQVDALAELFPIVMRPLAPADE